MTARASAPATSTCSTGSTTRTRRPGPTGARAITATTGRASRCGSAPAAGPRCGPARTHGYNYGPDVLSDVGRRKILLLTVDGREAAWGPEQGYVWVSAGSHAGRADGGESYFRSVPARHLRLLPLEPDLELFDALGYDPEIAPPWRKGSGAIPRRSAPERAVRGPAARKLPEMSAPL